MMQLYLFHFQPHHMFHFGQRGVGIEATTDYLPSDMLFSALCSVLRLITSKEDVDSFLQAFQRGEPTFLCSSGFPYILVNNQPLRFYPAPLTLQRSARDGERKARWVSETLFWHYVQTGHLGEAELLPELQTLVTLEEYNQIQATYELLSRQFDGRLPLWVAGDTARVAIDRQSNASNVFRSGSLSIVEQGGIWCGFAYQDTRWCETYLPSLLTILGDGGSGGERSSGYSQYILRSDFTHSRQVKDMPSGYRFITLSHYAPNYEANAVELECLGPESAYGLDVRRGWLGSPANSNLRRQSVRMVVSGSVLQTVDVITTYGRLAQVTPDEFRTEHEVWRYGYALPIPLEA